MHNLYFHTINIDTVKVQFINFLKLKIMLRKIIICSLLCFFSTTIFAQKNNTSNKSTINKGKFLGKTIPIRDIVSKNDSKGKVNRIKIFKQRKNVSTNRSPQRISTITADPLRQRNLGLTRNMQTDVNFEGLTQTEGGFRPPDPTGAAGPNHYFGAVNSTIEIYDKLGNTLVNPMTTNTFFGLGPDVQLGDPIVLYDHLADRWFLGIINAGTSTENRNTLTVAVSDSSDPTGSYNIYSYDFDQFPDFPKFTVWHDGYYITLNTIEGNTTFVMERDVMLAGGANPQIIGFSMPEIVRNPDGGIFSTLPAHLSSSNFVQNSPGYIVYLQDDDWDIFGGSGISSDHLKVWSINVDWENASLSSISQPLEIGVAPFDSRFNSDGFGNGASEQPGTPMKIDMIAGVPSFTSNYRVFPNHNSWMITFNVNVDGNDTSGIRWVELRNSETQDWFVYQEGTYAPDDGNNRFMGNAAIDAEGNIALAYHVAGPTLPVATRYTGRLDGETLGQMTIQETSIVESQGVQTVEGRFGDYAHLTMDPDNFTFWFTSEYFSADNFWNARVASFQFSSFTNDVGPTSLIQPEDGALTNAENVIATIRNFGTASQTNFPVSLYVDNVLIVTDMYTGNILPDETVNHTFSQTLDLSTLGQTYEIRIETDLTGDEFSLNDEINVEVKHLFNDDVGIVDIITPISGEDLTSETVSVVVRNFGLINQTNFPIHYSINGNAPVVETFTGTIAVGEDSVFNFTTLADLSQAGAFQISVATDLSTDQDVSNDEILTEVTNLCQPMGDCSFNDGFTLFSIADLNNPSGCEGYADFRSLIANLDAGTTYPLTVESGFAQYVSVWIDFNDDFDLTTDELVVNNVQMSGSTDVLDLVMPNNSASGTHLMRARATFDEEGIGDACFDFLFGEVEDYSVNIGTLSVVDQILVNSELTVYSMDNNVFDITFNSSLDENIYLSVYSILGQKLKTRPITKYDENNYKIILDMQGASNGVYIVKIGNLNASTFKTTKIIVR